MRLRSGRSVLAVAGAILIIGGLVAPAADAHPVAGGVSAAVSGGDLPPEAMTRAQARTAY
jgi:hypothetical protein